MELPKITQSPEIRRRYDDACAAAHALDLVGDRWTLLVIREMTIGPRRFSDLRRDLPGISANVLTQRLAHLEATGIAARTELPALPGVTLYALTPWGQAIEPVFAALGRWGVRSPWHADGAFSMASFRLSLITMFDPARAPGHPVTVGFRAPGAAELVARIANGALDVAPGEADGATAVLDGTPGALAGAIYGPSPLADLEAQADVAVSGDVATAQAFADAFHLPGPDTPSKG